MTFTILLYIHIDYLENYVVFINNLNTRLGFTIRASQELFLVKFFFSENYICGNRSRSLIVLMLIYWD